MADIEEVLRIVSETLTTVKMHDQKVDFSVAALRESQSRLAEAMEKSAAATTALQAATEALIKKNGQPVITQPRIDWTPKMLLWLVAGALVVGISMKGGGDLLGAVLAVVLHK